MISQIYKKKYLPKIIIALLISVVVFYSVEYLIFKLDSGLDLNIYLNSFDRSLKLNFLSPTYLFYSIYFFLTNITINPILSLQIISAGSIFFIIIALATKLNEKNFYLLFLLLHPRFIDCILSQTRSAFALTLCLTSFYLIKNRFLKIFVSFCSFIMHISLFPIVFFYYYFKDKNNKKADLKSIYSKKYNLEVLNRLFYLMIYIFLYISLFFIAKYLGLRGSGVASSTTITYSMMWIFTAISTLCVFCYSLKHPTFENYLLSILVFSAPILNIIGIESTRLYAYAIPFACISLGQINKINRTILFFIFILNQTLSTYFWVKVIF